LYQCDRGDRGEFGHTCGEQLLPAQDSYTAFFRCHSDCSRGPLIQCPARFEDDLLRRARVTKAAWDAYVLRLYDVDRSQLHLLPRISSIDIVYSRMLPLHGVEAASYDVCPRTANHAPLRLEQPHISHAAYYTLAEAPTPAPSNSWVEITHCASNLERESLWFYVQRGSGMFVNVGNTIVFQDHPQAAEHFGVYGDVTNVPAAAAAAGYDTIQYLEHCEGCRCDYELLFVSKTGDSACPSGIEFRSGINASQPCDCQPARIGSSSHPMCITCSSFSNWL